MEKVDGAAIQNVASVKVLKEITIQLPPLEEQKRLVKKFDLAFTEIDNCLESFTKKLDELKNLRSAILSQELTSKR